MTPFLPEGAAKHVYDLFAVLVHSGAHLSPFHFPLFASEPTELTSIVCLALDANRLTVMADGLCRRRARRALLLLPQVAGER